jgi:septal ring factor EnvC (AmiA/AmiB activator)
MAKVVNSARTHPVAAIFVGLTAVGFIIDLIKKFTISADAVEWLIRQGVYTDAKGQLQIAIWFRLTTIVAFGLVILLLVALWTIVAEIRRAKSELSSSKQELDAARSLASAAETTLNQIKTDFNAAQTELSLVRSELTAAQTIIQKKAKSALKTLEGMIDAAFRMRQN